MKHSFSFSVPALTRLIEMDKINGHKIWNAVIKCDLFFKAYNQVVLWFEFCLAHNFNECVHEIIRLPSIKYVCWNVTTAADDDGDDKEQTNIAI